MKVKLTEAQFRDYMRYKLHEGKSEGKKIRLTEEQMRFIVNNKLAVKEEKKQHDSLEDLLENFK